MERLASFKTEFKTFVERLALQLEDKVDMMPFAELKTSLLEEYPTLDSFSDLKKELKSYVSLERFHRQLSS